MRRYETIIIFDPDLSADQRAPVLNRIDELLNQFKGFLIEAEEWGSRKLAYLIKKKERGFYQRLDFCGPNEFVTEMERFFRIDDRVMKYMTVLLEQAPEVDEIKAEMAAAEQRKQEAAQAAAAAENAQPAPDENAPAEDTPAETTPEDKTPAQAEAASTETEEEGK